MTSYRMFLLIPLLMLKTVMAVEPKEVPPLLQSLQTSGVSLKFLTVRHGLHVWEARKAGDVRLLYLTPDREGLLLGSLYDKEGLFLSARPEHKSADSSLKAPTQEFWKDIESTRWFSLGSSSAPLLYMISDPSCEHCLTLVERLLPFIEKEKVQVRVMLVSFLGEKSEQEAAHILESKNAAQAFLSHIKNPSRSKKKFSPAPETLRHLEGNNAFMSRWNITTTPFSIFKDRQGHLKIMEGIPENMENVIKMF